MSKTALRSFFQQVPEGSLEYMERKIRGFVTHLQVRANKVHDVISTLLPQAYIHRIRAGESYYPIETDPSDIVIAVGIAVMVRTFQSVEVIKTIESALNQAGLKVVNTKGNRRAKRPTQWTLEIGEELPITPNVVNEPC